MWTAITPSPAGCQARSRGRRGLVGKNCSSAQSRAWSCRRLSCNALCL